ncbi:MAG: hypothetical protein NTY76_08175 [Candidatus Omnitrophica bacterium]|nr:hypothetical protein [Candidatus Omnitrophota bacterium]
MSAEKFHNNNKIPPTVHQFLQNDKNKSAIDFLGFKDWLSINEHTKKDWIIVARAYIDDNTGTDFFTYSALAEVGDKEKNIKILLQSHDWEVSHNNFGYPEFYTEGGSKDIKFNTGEKESIKDIEFRPFILKRYFNGYVDDRFEIAQSFILFHNLFYVPELSEFQKIDKDGNVISIIKILNNEKQEEIKVDSTALRDYLAAYKSCLVRYHDHRRRSKVDITDYIGGEFKELVIKERDWIFLLWLRMDIPCNGNISASRFLGKDIVLPFPEVLKEHTDWANLDREDKCVSFIIGVDNKGNVIEAPCDEKKLSNYFTDKGTPHFLTPAYFDRKTLSKYYSEPRKYKIESRHLGCLDLWSLPIDTTDEGLIQVWLGDLGCIPYQDQLHWRQYNIPPKGGITKHRWQTDFMAEFSEPANDPVYYIKKAFENLQGISKERLGDLFFLPFNKKESYLLNIIRVPLTNEWKEFDEIIQALAKILCDSLNVRVLQKFLGLSIGDNGVNGSIDLLNAFIAKLHNKKLADNLTKIFYKVQKIRSSSAAHRKGKEFDRILKMFDYYNKAPHDIISELMIEIIKGLEQLATSIQQLK